MSSDSNSVFDDVIYDESFVPQYRLPKIKEFANGAKVASDDDWLLRRKEILSLLANHVYGESPTELPEQSETICEHSQNALDGLACRKQIEIKLHRNDIETSFRLLIYAPKAVQPSACFLGLNFKGNHTVHGDPRILKDDELPTERAALASRWPIEQLIQAGYAVATIHYEDVLPDRPGAPQDSLPSLYPDEEFTWGSISVWAFALSRALDVLEKQETINEKQIIAIGHSRLGKAALWAAAQDKRFAAVVSNNSGCGGAALFRRCFGERIHHINERFPHWFTQLFKTYNYKEQDLPVDQHMLLALIAPRPIYIASASKDEWADPKGEFLVAQEVSKIYNDQSLNEYSTPPLNKPILSRVSYHMRSGNHDLTYYDWQNYIAFADRYIKR